MKSSLILQTSLVFRQRDGDFFQETHTESCIKVYNTRHVTCEPRSGTDVVERDLLAEGTCSGTARPDGRSRALCPPRCHTIPRSFASSLHGRARPVLTWQVAIWGGDLLGPPARQGRLARASGACPGQSMTRQPAEGQPVFALIWSLGRAFKGIRVVVTGFKSRF